MQTQAREKFAQYKQRPDPQVLNIFKKRGFFTFEVVADELKNPSYHKNYHACGHQNTALVERVHNG
jgi:hypothetical protein